MQTRTETHHERQKADEQCHHFQGNLPHVTVLLTHTRPGCRFLCAVESGEMRFSCGSHFSVFCFVMTEDFKPVHVWKQTVSLLCERRWMTSDVFKTLTTPFSFVLFSTFAHWVSLYVCMCQCVCFRVFLSRQWVFLKRLWLGQMHNIQKNESDQVQSNTRRALLCNVEVWAVFDMDHS